MAGRVNISSDALRGIWVDGEGVAATSLAHDAQADEAAILV
jgi:hypothetical protein